MKTIIAGSRKIKDAVIVECAVKYSGFAGKITEVVSGRAKGVDELGEEWAVKNNIPVTTFPVTEKEWRDLKAPGARIKTRHDGTKFNANAAHDRNQRMADYADALIAVWDNKSPGTRDMIKRAQARGLKVFIYRVVR